MVNATPTNHDASHARPRERRALALAFSASLCAHLALVGLISLRGDVDAPVMPHVLEVVIAQPPRPLPTFERRPNPPAPPKREPQRQPRIEAAQPHRMEEPRPQPSQPKPVLALPAETPAPPAFTVPQAPPADSKPPSPEPKVALAPRDAPGGDAAPMIPPSFNAAYLRNEPPRYPVLARRNGVEGRVNLKVLVTREGRAAQVQIYESSGSSTLDSAALDAVKNWQFVPARRGQEAIESSVIVPIVFKLDKAG